MKNIISNCIELKPNSELKSNKVPPIEKDEENEELLNKFQHSSIHYQMNENFDDKFVITPKDLYTTVELNPGLIKDIDKYNEKINKDWDL